MGRPKKSAPKDEIIDGEEIPTTVTTSETTEVDYTPDDVAVMNMIEEFGADDTTRVRIYRQGPSYRDLILINECSPDDFDAMILAHPPYNGGTFRIHVRSKSGIAMNRQLKVAPAPDALKEGEKPVAGNAQMDMMTMMGQMLQANREALLAGLAAMKPAETDPLKTIDGLSQLAKIIAPAHAPVAQVQEDSFGKTMKMMETFMSFQEKLKPAPGIIKDDGELSMPGVVMEAIRTFKDMKAPALSQPTAGNVVPIDPNQPTASQIVEFEEMQIVIKWQMKQACNAAKNGANPNEYAESIYTTIPDEVLTSVGSDPNWFAQVEGILPETKQYKSWFLLVGEKIKSMMREDGLLTDDKKGGDNPPNAHIDASTSS